MHRVARAAGVVLLEAYPWWFQPQTGAMLELLRGGAIGSVRAVQVSFGFKLDDPQGKNIRSIAALGGGALMDAGCYCLSLIRLVMGRAPQSVQADLAPRADRRRHRDHARRCSSRTAPSPSSIARWTSR